MGQAAELFTQIQRTIGATQRVRELLTEPTELSIATHSSSTSHGPRVRGRVEFRDVCFRYPSRPETPVLTNVNLVAEPGEVVALVGPSGAGKSTITAMLLRFYNPEAGTILVDDKDAREYPLDWLRSQMALVPQDVILFGGTIAENIAYGKPGADEVEIIAAARQANAHEFISSFP